MHAATRGAHTTDTTLDLQPVFTSWGQLGALLRRRLTAARTRLSGSAPQHRLHLPCRHSGGTYALPVTITPLAATPQTHAEQEPPQMATHDASAPAPTCLQLTVCDSAVTGSTTRDWQQDAAAARFAVLATDREQLIVELLPPAPDAPHPASPVSPHAMTLRVVLPAPYRAPVATTAPRCSLPLPRLHQQSAASTPTPQQRPRLPILT